MAFAATVSARLSLRRTSNATVSLDGRKFTACVAHKKAPARLRTRGISSIQACESADTDNAKHAHVQDPFLAGRGDVTCPDVGFQPTLTTGAAQIAADRSVDMSSLSRMYGAILAGQMLQLNIDEVQPEMVIDGMHLGWRDLESPMDVAAFELLMKDGNLDEASASEVKSLSQMYGFLLGTTLRMSCLELNLELVAGGFRTRCTNPDMVMPLEPAEYDRQFMELQQIAGALQFDSNLADADRFFNRARGASNMQRVREDASIIYLKGSYCAPEEKPMVMGEDTILVVIAGRLLDGRAFLVPSFSDGVEKPADTVSIPLSAVPKNLAAGIIGMRENEVRTIYIHPRAAEGISALFSAQPFPPNSAVIFDVLLSKIVPPVATARS
jgi:hypothetical protein